MASLLLIVPAGLLMFSPHPHEFLDNCVFLLKLMLIGAAGLNAGVFHFGVYRSVTAWDKGILVPLLVRLHAAASLVIWLAMMGCGRLLAYI